MYDWVDPTGDPEMKSAYLYLHHDGPKGPANIRACMAGIAKLNGAVVGGSGIPDNDRRGVYNHLAAHLIEADIQPNELTDGKSASARYGDQADGALATVYAFLERSGDLLGLRRGKGQVAHTALNAKRLEWLYDALGELRVQLDTPQEDAARELARFIQLEQELGV